MGEGLVTRLLAVAAKAKGMGLNQSQQGIRLWLNQPTAQLINQQTGPRTRALQPTGVRQGGILLLQQASKARWGKGRGEGWRQAGKGLGRTRGLQ